MSQNKIAQEKFNQLRRQAEEFIRSKDFVPLTAHSEDPMKLIHELSTYQIELEMQNEELRVTQEALEAERARYFDLYDFAPVGYITLSKEGLILKANLAAADLFGVPRNELIKQPLTRFILKEDQDIHYLKQSTFFKSQEPQKYELRMINRAGVPFWVNLTASAARVEDAQVSRMVLINITEQKQLLDAQTFLLTCGLPATGEDFFQSLSRYLSGTLGMEYVCIDRLTGKDLSAQTVAAYNSGNFEANLCDVLKNAPCKKAMGKGICCYPKGVQQLFPEDAALRELMAESYLGTTLMDSKGRKIGLIAVIGRHAMVDPKLAQSLLSLVAPHAASELERRQSQSLLEENRLQLETILNNIDLSIYITDLETNKILFINKYLRQFYTEDLIGRICWESFHEGRNAPCEFCTKSRLTDADGNAKDSCVSEFYNKKRNKWYEKNDSAIPWIDGNLVHMGITKNITRQKMMQEKQLRIKTILEEKVKMRTSQLEDMNATLRVLLEKREKDKDEIEDKIFANHKLILSPILNTLKKNLAQGNNMDMITLLESELKNIISPFSKKLSDRMINLTPTEIHVADLIKHGKSNKEISTLLDSSVHTIARHRENIRRKIGLKNTKTNLRSFLLTLQ